MNQQISVLPIGASMYDRWSLEATFTWNPELTLSPPSQVNEETLPAPRIAVLLPFKISTDNRKRCAFDGPSIVCYSTR